MFAPNLACISAFLEAAVGATVVSTVIYPFDDYFCCLTENPGDIDNRSIRRGGLTGLNPHAPCFTSKSIGFEDLKLEDILTPVPYQLNGSHVNGGDNHLIVKDDSGEEIEESWVGAENLASYKRRCITT